MMSFATSSVFVPFTANMFPQIAAVFVSFAEPPPCLRFGAVANDVEIGAAASPADEVIGSSRQVNALGNELLGERLPTIDLAHDDLA